MVDAVALDTNALMMPVELDVRLFDELDRLLGGTSGGDGSAGFEPVVPQSVVEELRRLSESGGEEGIAASVGHDLATAAARQPGPWRKGGEEGRADRGGQ